MRLIKNLERLKLDFQCSRLVEPKYVLLDQSSYFTLCQEVATVRLQKVLGLTIVMVASIPELCTIVAEPWEEIVIEDDPVSL